MENPPRIYVSCLSAYTNGKLHGTWIDCDKDADEIMSEIKAMLEYSPEPDAEEWRIDDYENWHSIKIKEYQDIEEIASLAELIKEHGAAFAFYYTNYDDCDNFEEYYCGSYESEEDFVKERLSEQGIIEKCEAAGLSESYIDWEAIARDWFISDYFSVEEGYKEVHVFNRY